jgi:putative salt-induced outer membrane protein YdiY
MRKTILGFLAASAALLATAALAADEPKRPWTDAAELGLVMTSGNAEGTNFAFANKFKYTWSNAELAVDAAALRSESTTRTLSNPAGTVVVDETSAVTAASYSLGGKYRRNISERFYWYAGAGWEQNFFAGIDDRYIAGGGLGYTFVKTDRHLLKGELGVDYTREDPLGDPPPVELETKSFAGLHGFLGYEFKFGEKSKLTEDLSFFENLDTTSDWRANSVTALSASLNTNLALKLSYTVKYSNEPPVTEVPPDATAPIGTLPALFTFDTTDTILTAALVINF